jgi:Protein of unknown function (DUF1553)/Protein of unknown function (DUF1549)
VFVLTVGSAVEAGLRPPVSPFESSAELAPDDPIDELVIARLKTVGLQPARLCSDAVFVRRAYLDIIGTLPTAKEASDFFASKAGNKRQTLVEQLLERDEFADYCAMKWSDLLRIKAEFPINLWPNAAQAYHHWVRTCMKDNLPYDQFVRQLLTSSGSNFRVAPVNFYRAMQNKEPSVIAQTVALTLMGTRTERWPKERLSAMAPFFAQIGHKQTAEWKEEIVFFDPAKEVAAPGLVAFPDGTPARLAPDQDPREAFANWLIDSRNPWFGRNIVNRIWSWLMGRGIIHEPDDIRPDNPPSNPELLAFLERELVNHRYDLRHIYRLILTSKTYQLSSIPAGDLDSSVANFAVYPVRRLDGEVLIDALNQITGTTEHYSSSIPEPFTFIPEGQRSVALPDGSISSPFLELFGRPARDTGLESERNNRPTAAQSLHLLNSSHIQRKLEQSHKLRNLLESKASQRDIVSGLYLMILSRYPTEQEWKIVARHAGGGDGEQQRDALVDLAWALINTTEFLCRH